MPPLIRLAVEPTKQNGLNAASQVMVDKITTAAKSKLQKRVGKLAEEDMIRLNRAFWCSSAWPGVCRNGSTRAAA